MSVTNTLYVFTSALPTGEPVLVGKLTGDDGSGVGTFQYAPDWLRNPAAFAIDPLNLPLDGAPTVTRMNSGVFNVLLDAGPDRWGKHLMNRIMDRPPRSNIELLLAASGGAGALLYSASRKGATNHAESIYIDPETLADYVHKLEQDVTDIPDFIKAVLFAGSSIGGARPKLLVRDENGVEYIAKLNKDSDDFNVARVERSMLQFAEINGIRAPETKIQPLQGRDTLWVRRFDRNAGQHLHYISAHSLLNGHRVRTGDEGKHISYAGIAEVIRKISSDPKADCLELFKRAVVNILVANTDDHLKNHGFIRTAGANSAGGYRLSQVFDIVPQPNQTRLQAIGIGMDRTSSLDELLTRSSAFYLSQAEAANVIKSVIDSTPSLRGIMTANGVNEAHQRIVWSIVEEKIQTFQAGADLLSVSQSDIKHTLEFKPM